MKRIMRVALALIMVLAMSAPAFAAGVTHKGAQNKALKNAKLKRSSVTRLRVEYDGDDGIYEVKFRSRKNGAKYSYDILASSGRIVEKTIDYRYARNHSMRRIGRTAAMRKAAKIANTKLSVVRRGSCKYEYDDGKGTYELKFKKGKRYYEIDLLAPTGQVMECKWKVYHQPPVKTEASDDYDDDND